MTSDSPPAGPLRVRAVESRRDLHRWIGVPWQLDALARDPSWVAPLRVGIRDGVDRARNPFYADADRALFIAERGGRPVGRIAAIENRAHNRHHGDRLGFFGFFECADDAEAASTLFDAAAGWLRGRGLERMQGPMNPSTNYECGLLVDCFEGAPTFMTSWNPPYYDALVRGAGCVGVKDLLSFWFSASADELVLPPFVERLARRALGKGGVTLRSMDPGNAGAEAEACWDIYNSAWEANWGFVPLARAEFLKMAADMKPLADPRFAMMAEVDGVPAGFVLGMPDYNEALRRNPSGRLFPLGALRLWLARRRTRGYRVMALGVKPEFRSRSILALFTHEFIARLKLHGKAGVEASWLLEDNTLIVKPMRDMGARETRRWRLYERSTEPLARSTATPARTPD